ncbi:MAG: 50S ribosomal protein L13 [Actinomycetota bacterium]|nr:50S ribosomal protein L13 [Actinomycetota bacterium]
MRTYSASAREIQRQWYVADAKDQVLGRLASRVAQVLRGKHKPMFTPHLDTGDYVIVVNAAEVRLTGAKASQKFWYRHSGYPGGLKSVPFARLLAETPEKAVAKAIRGMLPKNKLGRQMATKLKVYAGPEHPHAAQQPKPLPLQVASDRER